MNHSEQQHAHTNEPSLETSAAGQPAPASAEMPSWLAKPPAPPSAAQRWGRRFMFLGVATLAVALAGGATMLGLEMYESHSAMELIANKSQAELAARQAKPVSPAQSSTLPFVEQRPVNVPPLVLVPQAPGALKDAAAAPPVAQVAREAAVAAARNAPAATAIPSRPVAKPKAAAVAGKPATALKRASRPVKAKAKARAPAKRVKGIMLQPPRDRSGERVQDAPERRQAIDRRCRPGELARECEARTR